MSSSLEFRLAFDSALDDPLLPEPEVPDAFAQFRADAELAAALGGRSGHQHVANFREETSQLDKDLAAHYRKIAAKAEKNTPPVPLASNELRKRFGGSEKSIFRKFFAEQRAMGESIPAILNKFTPEARREFAGILQELCEEFEQAA
jgi:hypothetical protein